VKTYCVSISDSLQFATRSKSQWYILTVMYVTSMIHIADRHTSISYMHRHGSTRNDAIPNTFDWRNCKSFSGSTIYYVDKWSHLLLHSLWCRLSRFQISIQLLNMASHQFQERIQNWTWFKSFLIVLGHFEYYSSAATYATSYTREKILFYAAPSFSSQQVQRCTP
jgi:hypothetical protein